MKRLALPLALLPSAALAHPGDHADFTPLRAVAHVLRNADHLAVLVVVAALVAWPLWRRLRARR